MKEILQEGISSIVYHFTTLEALNTIIETNTISFSVAKVNKVDKECQPPGYDYFLSLTRQSSPDVGYPAMKDKESKDVTASIDEESDGEAFRDVKAKQIGDFGIHPSVRRRIIKKNSPEPNQQTMVKPTGVTKNKKGETIVSFDKNQVVNRDKISQNNETEERIFSKTRYFENVYDYILRIDILPSKALNVRICFDGNKLNQRFLGGPVDFIYRKYINAVNHSTLVEDKQDIPDNILSKEDWAIIKNCLLPKKTKKKVGKDTYNVINVHWDNKIFLHLTDKTIHLGSVMLKQKSGDSKIIDKISNSSLLKNKANKLVTLKRGKKAKRLPDLKDGDINKILKFIVTTTPPGSRPEKIKICRDCANNYFSNLPVKYTGKKYAKFKNKEHDLCNLLIAYLTIDEPFWDMWNNTTKDKNKFKLTSKFIAGAYKDYSGDKTPVYDRIERLLDDFLSQNGLETYGQIVTYQWNKYYQSVSPDKTSVVRGRKPKQKTTQISEEDIHRMVCEVLKNVL